MGIATNAELLSRHITSFESVHFLYKHSRVDYYAVTYDGDDVVMEHAAGN